MKKAVSDKFGLYLHFHDGCGSQYFSFDAPVNEEVQEWLKDYFRANWECNVKFTPSCMEFTLDEMMVEQILNCDENRKIDTINYQNSLNIDPKIVAFESAIKFIEKFGGLKYTNKKTNIQYDFLENFPCNHNKILEFINSQNELVAPVGYIMSEIWGVFTLVINEKNEIYLLEYHTKIARNIDEFFCVISSNKNFIDFKIDDATITQLKNSGWYPKRKVDISQLINNLKSRGFPLFDKAEKFYQEFFGLCGITSYGIKWEILNDDILDEYTPDILEDSDFRYRIPSEAYLPVCIYYNYPPYNGDSFYITETGKFFCETGKLVGNNALEFFNSLFKY